MKKILAHFILLCFQSHLYGQLWTWDKPASAYDGLSSIARDPANNLYLFNSLYTTAPGAADTIKKTDASGQLIWQYDFCPGLSVTILVAAPDSGCFVAGLLIGTVSVNSNTYNSTGSADSWIARFNKSGTLMWFKTIAGKSVEIVNDICIQGTKVIVTGMLGDTTTFLGTMIPKPKSRDLFIAIINSAGNLQNIKLSEAGAAGNYDIICGGNDCEADASGNIYLLAYASGHQKIDTFSISTLKTNGASPYAIRSYSLLRFNTSLQLQSVKLLSACYNYCFDYRNLAVNARGDCYFLQDYRYFQSGVDYDWTTVYKLDHVNNTLKDFRLKKGSRNCTLYDLELDNCGNVYFTGWWKTSANSTQPKYNSPVVGKLSPAFALNWVWQDSTVNNVCSGNSIAVLGVNDLYVNGYIEDTCEFYNVITTGPQGGGFFGRFGAPGAIDCTAGINGIAEEENETFNFYPNPTTAIIYMTGLNNDAKVEIFSVDGKLVLTGTARNNAFNLDSLVDGIYFVRLTDTNGKCKSRKLILNK